MKRLKIMALPFLVTLFLLVGGGGALIYLFITKTTVDPEIIMGIVIVFAITALMTVLFIVAAGFKTMKLTDPKQALGLPEGSIRATIALVLIMVFIIFGIFLFRKVGIPSQTYLGEVKKTSDFKTDNSKLIVFFQAIPSKEKIESQGDKRDTIDYNNYYVYGVSEVSEEGKRLAQQLITTVGTLYVAISSFYFGNAMAKSDKTEEPQSIQVAQTHTSILNPVIKDITPKEGKKGQEIAMEILGTDFKAPVTVQLLRGSEAMICGEVLSNATKIQCKVIIDKEPDGKWDVIVSNEDGKRAQLTKVFTIIKT
jgi:hypothetical protein